MKTATVNASASHGADVGSIGPRLRMERERLGLSQDALAAACGVTRRTQVNYERDVHPPSVVYLDKLAALGVDTEFVMTGARAGQHGTAQRAALALLEQLLRALGYADVPGILAKAAAISTGTSPEYSGSGIPGFAARLVGESSTLQSIRVLATENAMGLDLSLLAETIDLIEQGVAKRSMQLTAGKRAILVSHVYAHAMANDNTFDQKQIDQLFALMG